MFCIIDIKKKNYFCSAPATVAWLQYLVLFQMSKSKAIIIMMATAEQPAVKTKAELSKRKKVETVETEEEGKWEGGMDKEEEEDADSFSSSKEIGKRITADQVTGTW
jgi:hypothetical protein